MEYFAKDFNNRKQLDLAMKTRIEEEDDVLVGTREELKRLLLKEGKKVYGVPAVLSKNKTNFLKRIVKSTLDKKTILTKTK